MVDAEGRPLPLNLTAGQAGDAPAATKLFDTVAPGATVIADKDCDTDGIRSFCAERGAWATTQSCSTRKATFASSHGHRSDPAHGEYRSDIFHRDGIHARSVCRQHHRAADKPAWPLSL